MNAWRSSDSAIARLIVGSSNGGVLRLMMTLRKTVDRCNSQCACVPCRLRPLQAEGHLVIAIGDDLLEVAVPGFARIEAQLVGRLAQQQVPGAFDVLGGERPAVMPFDALAQLEGQRGLVLLPRPLGRQI